MKIPPQFAIMQESHKQLNIPKFKSLPEILQFGYAYLGELISQNQDSLIRESNSQVKTFFEQNQNLGALLIRPEMFHHTPEIIKFLEKQGLEIIWTKKQKITPSQFVSICRESIGLEAAKYMMPTRAMVYMSGTTNLIICKRKAPSNLHLADHLVNNLKGTGGIWTPNTIRGEVVLREATRLGFGTLRNLEIANAIDPLGLQFIIPSYLEIQTNLAKMQILSSLVRQTYNSVCVHIPSSEEIARDLSSLLTIEDLNLIKQKL